MGKFAVLNLILCTGAIWRRREKFEYGCTTTYHQLFKAPKLFLKITRLNTVSVITNVDTDIAFSHNLYELEKFLCYP